MKNITRLSICLLTAFFIVSCVCSPPRTIEVGPGSADITSRAISGAHPGDVVLLKPGTYKGTITIDVSGSPEKPIIIRGTQSKPASPSETTVVDGGAAPDVNKFNPAFHIKNASWIVIEDIAVRNAWRDAIVVEDSSYVTVRCCDIQGGQTAVFAKGDSAHHILVEHCRWSQDKRVYTEWDWATLHHGSLVMYNGGIYGGDGAGGAIVRNNFVENVFNGFRYWLDDPVAAKRMNQSNIEVYDNYFRRCRDNIIEPECFAWNLHVYHNRLDSCPRGVFSIDGVSGGNIYIYGNTGRWKHDGCVEEKDTAWTIYKSGDYDKKRHLDTPMYIFHNSFAYDTAFVYSSRIKCNDNIIHFNNAYLHLSEKSDFGLKDWIGKSCMFDYDISSKPWQPSMVSLGFEAHGIANTDPGFTSSAEDNFHLKKGSPAIDHGKDLDGFTLWYQGAGPDMGAYEGDQTVYGKPFLYSPPPGGELYHEKPRIVRMFLHGRRLVVFFSADLEPDTMTDKNVMISFAGKPALVKSVSFPGPAYAAVVELAENPPVDADACGISFNGFPKGKNGETATLWAVDDRIVRIPQDAKLAGVMKQLLK